MDIATRNAHVFKHIDNLARDIDQPHGECESALDSIIGAATAVRDGLNQIRDGEIAIRRQRQVAKQAHADSIAAGGSA